MSKQNDLAELIQAGIITQATAERIRDFYKNKRVSSSNSLFIVFGILGAILVGLGIILIIAHNWDDLSREIKTTFAVSLLMAGQLICAFVLIKKHDSSAWRESSAAFLFFAVGASITLISQIYNIPGNISSFLITWMLLSLPVVYMMKSSIASLLYIIGITYYAIETGYISRQFSASYWYWLLLFGCLPHYYQLYRKNENSNFLHWHHWLVPLSVVIVLGTVAKKTAALMPIAYISLFGVLYLIGNFESLVKHSQRNNGYRVLGSLGTIITLLILSFDEYWKDLIEKKFTFNEVITSPEFISCIIVTLIAGCFFFIKLKNNFLKKMDILMPAFILFIVIFIVGLYSPISMVLINIYVFAIGIFTVRKGASQHHLGIMNYGLLIITALVTCRFFDAELSFVARGIIFIAVGAGFFATNIWMLRKRKRNEE